MNENDNNSNIENDVNIEVSNDECVEVENLSKSQMKNSRINQITWTGIANQRIRIKFERSKSLSDATHQLDEFDPLRRRIASILSLSDFGGDVNVSKPFESHETGFW